MNKNQQESSNRQTEYVDRIKDDANIFRIVKLTKNNLKEELQLKENSELFKLLREIVTRQWNPSESKPLIVYPVENFESFLNKKAKTIYLTKVCSTVIEYNVLNFLFWEFNSYNHKFLFNLLQRFYTRKHTFPITYYTTGQRKANLIQYIALEAEITLEKGYDYYIPRMAKLYNYLADKGIIKFCNLDKLNVVPLFSKENNTVCFTVWPLGSVNETHIDINKKLPFDIFVNEGEVIYNFNWNQIDQLCQNK